MIGTRVRGVLAHAARTYLGLGRGLLRTRLLLAIITAAAAVVVVPLWLFATRSPRAFTTAGLSLLGCGIAAALVSRGRRGLRSAGSLGRYLRKTLLPRVAGVVALCALLVWAYWTVVFYAAGVPAAAVPLTVGWVAAVGATAAAFKARTRREG